MDAARCVAASAASEFREDPPPIEDAPPYVETWPRYRLPATVTPEHYELSLTTDVESENVEGHVNITVEARCMAPSRSQQRPGSQ